MKKSRPFEDLHPFENLHKDLPIPIGDVEELDKAVAEGFDINKQRNNGYTFLMEVCERGVLTSDFDNEEDNLALIKELIKLGADLNVKNKHGFTALEIVINSMEYNKVYVLKDHEYLKMLSNRAKELIKGGADVNVTKYGMAPLEMLTRAFYTRPNKDKAVVIVDLGKDLIKESSDKTIQNALSSLINIDDDLEIYFAEDLLKELIKVCKDLNAKNKIGRTVLMYACSNGHVKAVKLLIKAGADLSIKDNEGLTAYDLAKKEHKNAKENLEIEDAQDDPDFIDETMKKEKAYSDIMKYIEYIKPMKALTEANQRSRTQNKTNLPNDLVRKLTEFLHYGNVKSKKRSKRSSKKKGSRKSNKKKSSKRSNKKRSSKRSNKRSKKQTTKDLINSLI